MSGIILWLSVYIMAKWWTEARQSVDPRLCGESNRSPNPTDSSRTGSDTKYARKWKHWPDELLCLSAFLDCNTWGGIWLQHNWVFCISAYGISWCVPAGKGFDPVYSFWVVSVIVIERNFILGELLNIQDFLSSVRTCINRMRVLNC